MSKRRSKKDRIHAKHHFIDAAASSIGDVSTVSTLLQSQQSEKDSSKNYLQEIFAYDPRLIVRDLKKTFFVTLFILVILLIITLIYT